MSLIKSLKRDKQFLKFTEVLDKISEYFNNAEKHLGNLNELLTLMFSLLQMENFLTDPY